ncbi:hypothetical protein [Brachybacterium phenoliresistens]|uniref:Uncharacterized protein n=1 Tax=Brachybacterium phenoliresistens TaxID=396014 RepID=Z9JWA8_9MICO|nr:hypothetical protein [Brachybacterium phenoliresistens]EWS82479.1 hypothetical protein BF93_12190 [Brachybacterium phenoliresistens]
MDSDAAPARPASLRRTVIAATLTFVLGLALGGAGVAGWLRKDAGPWGPGIACTAIGADDGVFVRFSEEAAGDATTATLRVSDGTQQVVRVQQLGEQAWSEDGTAFTSVIVAPMGMRSLTSVELVFTGPSGERTVAAEELGAPVTNSPNGEECEPHALQSSFRVEDGALVRADS